MSLLFGIYILFPQKVVNASVDIDDKVYYDYGAYDIQYVVDGIWHDGYNVRVIVTNKTNENIEDWEMLFKSQDTITNIWNAGVVYREGDLYIISNNTWNQTIGPQQSIVWGYTANYNDTPEYGRDFEVRERITENVTDEQFEEVFNAMLNCDLEDGERLIVNDAFVIECEEEEQEMPMTRAGAYISTKTGSTRYRIKVLSTSKVVFTVSQTVTIVVNSVKNTVRIKSYKATVDGATIVKQKVTSNLNDELSSMAPCSASVQIKYKNKIYYFVGAVTAYSTGKCRFSFTQI